MLKPNVTASTGCLKRLFPLHLSPIEAFMMADDRQHYPMTFVVELHLLGRIDRWAWETSLIEALARHPLLQARIQDRKGGLPCWVHSPDRAPRADWGEDTVGVECPEGEWLDLTQELGLRMWVRQGPERAVVTLQFHHACCDGIGAYRFIGDWLACYGIRTTTEGPPPTLNDLDPSLLRSRKQRTIDVATQRGRPLAWYGLREGLRILWRRPSPLLPPKHSVADDAAESKFPGFVSHFFSRDEHQQIRQTAGRHGVTLNDLLLRDLFLVMDRWNSGQRRWLKPGRLRIMMPTDLRDGDDYEMPATNMTSYTFLTRPTGTLVSPDALLRGIHDETALIKQERRGIAFMDTVAAGSSIRGLLPTLLSSNLCLATAVLSNVADPSRRFTATLPRRSHRIVAGNLVLEDFLGVPPLRPKTRATVSIFQYDRRLTLCLRCDPHRYSLADTRALLGLYVEQLRSTAPHGASATRLRHSTSTNPR